MDQARWEHLQELFPEFQALPEEEREAFLNTHAGEDEWLRAELLRLLHAAEDLEPGFLERPTTHLGWAGDHGFTLEPGSRVGEFVIERLIGRGGMGSIYLAHQESLKRRVALKVLTTAASIDGERELRFRTEALTAARLHHPHIVRIHAAGESEGLRYIAMDFIDGADMRQALAGEASSLDLLPAPTAPDHGRRVAGIVRDLARALDHAHAEGVLHRDVKPGNILIDRTGHVFLADFGLAKDLGEPAISSTGQFLGTPNYMSPEQAVLTRYPLDHRTDVFSLGAVFYELLGRRQAFHGKSIEHVLQEIFYADPAPLQRGDVPVHRDLETICLRALEKDPRHRFQSAGDFAAELDRFLAGEPLSIRPTPRPVRVWRRLTKNRPAAGLAGALLLVLLAFPLLLRVLRVDERPLVRIAGPRGSRVEVQQFDPVEHTYSSPMLLGDLPLAVRCETGPCRFTVQGASGSLREYDRHLGAGGGSIEIEAGSDVPEGNYPSIEIAAQAVRLVIGGEEPREVAVAAFAIDQYETSIGQYRAYLRATGAEPPSEWLLFPERYQEVLEPAAPGEPPRVTQYDDLPMAGLSWYDARDYAEWRGARLPTLAELALAGGGPEGRAYPWTDRPRLERDEVLLHAVLDATGGARSKIDEYLTGTRPVDSMASGASPFGLHHALGNVSEWTSTPELAGTEAGESIQSFIIHLSGHDWSLPTHFSTGPPLTLQVRNTVPSSHAALSFGVRCAHTLTRP